MFKNGRKRRTGHGCAASPTKTRRPVSCTQFSGKTRSITRMRLGRASLAIFINLQEWDTVNIQTLLTVKRLAGYRGSELDTYGANCSGVKTSSHPSFPTSSRTKKYHARSLAGPWKEVEMVILLKKCDDIR